MCYKAYILHDVIYDVSVCVYMHVHVRACHGAKECDWKMGKLFYLR